MIFHSNDPEEYIWKIIPGRKAAHALCSKGDKSYGICGRTSSYKKEDFTVPLNKTKRCEQCLIHIVCGHHYPSREQKNKYWKEYLEFLKFVVQYNSEI